MHAKKNESEIAGRVDLAHKGNVSASLDAAKMLATIEAQTKRIRTLEHELALVRCQQ